MKSIKTTLEYSLPNNIFTKSAYSATKLSIKLNIKSKKKHEYHHHVTYYVKCPVETSRENYICETGKRLSEHVIDRDKNPHVLKHCTKKENKLQTLLFWKKIISTSLEEKYKSNCTSRKSAHH